MTVTNRDDRILPVTRVIAALVIPFLVLAFLILYFFPQSSGERFAWQITPNIMAVYIGAGYLGGAYLFLRALIGKRWHHVSSGLPAITAFTWAMLLATILHWSRFDIRHFPFQLWLILYVVTPFLVPWLWWHNRPTDSGAPDERDAVVPSSIRQVVRWLGAAMVAVGVAGFIWPSLLINAWPWALTPLLARVVAGWGFLIGVGNLMISAQARWSSWRVAVGSIASWHVLYMIGSVIHRQDFIGGQWFNWLNLSLLAMLVLVGLLYLRMENKTREIG